jgi:hypothetical protein
MSKRSDAGASEAPGSDYQLVQVNFRTPRWLYSFFRHFARHEKLSVPRWVVRELILVVIRDKVASFTDVEPTPADIAEIERLMKEYLALGISKVS